MQDRVDAGGAAARHERHAQRDGERGFVLPDPYSVAPGTCNVQVVRSVSDWSHGQLIEHSIQNAYLQLINEANHFIYIGERDPGRSSYNRCLVIDVLSFRSFVNREPVLVRIALLSKAMITMTC